MRAGGGEMEKAGREGRREGDTSDICSNASRRNVIG